MYMVLLQFFFRIIFISILPSVSFTVHSLSCSSNETYVKFIKNSGSSTSSQESFVVYSGDSLLYSSPSFANDEIRVMEYCLPISTNSLYSIKLLDSYGNSWYSKSYLTIYGVYGNVVFKNFLTDGREEIHPFSLYYGILQNDLWKYNCGSNLGTWTGYNYDDSNWDHVYLGYVNSTVSITQYFRKQFTGLANMAAYDVRLYYKAGVIAYINGNEVYRDNMIDGEVTSTEFATGEHAELAYRGFIRSGSEVSSSQSILAVEIHSLSNDTISNITFNAYLAILAPSAFNTSCYIYGESVTVTSPISGGASNIFDYSKNSNFRINAYDLPSAVTFSFRGQRAFINSIRVWPSSSPATAPRSFAFQGSHDGVIWTTIVNAEDITYENNAYKMFTAFFHSSLYSRYRVNFIKSSTTVTNTYEMQPLICYATIPTSITYSSESYTFYIIYEEVSIRPDINEFTSCSASNLPNGLSIDSATCEISGFGTAVADKVKVTVTSIILGKTYTGDLVISLIECTGTMINVLRTYQAGAYYESFTIKDSSTKEVVMKVDYNSGQLNNQEWTNVACMTGTKYIVTVDSSTNYWQAASYLYVRAILAGNEMETILRMKYDVNIGFSSSRTFNSNFALKPRSQWYYKHSEVPENWYSSISTEGWNQGTDSTFTPSNNQIQLFKATFSVSDITNVAGVVLSIKYKYGIVVYMNGNEAFRNGVTGSVSTSVYATNIYSEVKYRQVSLPLKTVQVDEVIPVNYVQQGSNTIAIALIATNTQQRKVIFDCAIRLMGESTESRVFDYTSSYSKIFGSTSIIWGHHYSNSIYYSKCESNYLSIAFNNDRREWIDALTVKLYYLQRTQYPRQFILTARNSGEDWYTVANVTGLIWSQTGQIQTLYFPNNKACNEYRIENIGTGDSSNCYWRLGTFDLRSVMTTMTIPELSYPDSISIFKDIEMGEVYPNSEYYYGFTVTPELPNGITLNRYTGTVSGTATAESVARQYSVTAHKLTGGTSTTKFTLGVEVCTGGRSLITLVVRTDVNPEQSSYKLYLGSGTGGTVTDSIDAFQAKSSVHYIDFCKNDGIYTLELLDSSRNGWDNPAGYYLTVDLGAMIIEMGQVPSGVGSVTTMFSTFFPFQIEYTDWKISKEYKKNWNNLDFDDSAWNLVKANKIGTNDDITTYIRHDVNIPDVNQYHVLNVRVKYSGGIAAYFNGRLVARFNLEKNFSSETEAPSIHDPNSFSKFHAIMSTVGGVTGRNVVAFEVHRSFGKSSSSDVIFDATGVFGVNDCSIVVDTIAQLEGTKPTLGTIDYFLNLNPFTYGYQPNDQGTYLEWTVENLEGTKFNSFAMQTIYSRSNYGFSFYLRSNATNDYTSALAVMHHEVMALSRNAWSVPLGIVGFTQMKFVVDVPASGYVSLSSYILQYCKPSGSGVCPGIDDYPSVGEGEISPSICDYGYDGYSYRLCNDGVLGEIIRDNCTQKEPSHLLYDATVYNIILGTDVAISPPTYWNIINEFYMAEGSFLPMGLVLDSKTGSIHGIPVEEVVMNTYTIYGKNLAGITFVTVTISVRKGTCKAEGLFPTTYVGEVAEYDCALSGSFIGTQKRACILGNKDGEWQRIAGACISISVVVVIVIVLFFVLLIGGYILLRWTKRVKSVGGVKAKAKVVNKKALTTAKKVKV